MRLVKKETYHSINSDSEQTIDTHCKMSVTTQELDAILNATMDKYNKLKTWLESNPMKYPVDYPHMAVMDSLSLYQYPFDFCILPHNPNILYIETWGYRGEWISFGIHKANGDYISYCYDSTGN